MQKPGGQARHRSTKAEGGWAAVNTEYCAISPDSDETPFISARLWDDGDVGALSLMCDEVHEHGALAGVELHHSGVHCPRREYRLPAIGPSQLASDYLLVTPKAMELEDIRRVQSDWAAAARRAREAGFDIVYVYGAHSYLPMQFLSPFYNRRTDEYGGSLENRARFWLELLERTREAVDGECTVATRISVAALSPYGVELEEGLEFVRLADHLVDLWDVAVGSATEWSKDSGASRFFEQGWQLEWTKHVRDATAKPIVGVSRLTDPDPMAEIVSSGVWDVIGAARTRSVMRRSARYSLRSRRSFKRFGIGKGLLRRRAFKAQWPADTPAVKPPAGKTAGSQGGSGRIKRGSGPGVPAPPRIAKRLRALELARRCNPSPRRAWAGIKFDTSDRLRRSTKAMRLKTSAARASA